MDPRSLLLRLDPWLRGRSRRLAAELPGLDADEIYQAAALEFLRELDRWLQQDATVDVVAQARTLMAYALQHVRTTEIRRRRRLREMPEGEDGEGLDRVTRPVPPTDPVEARRVLAQVRAATTPPCALCLLSLRLPALVEREDASSAKAWRKGGANAVPRPLEEAWAIYEEGRGARALVVDEPAWKDHVGVAWYTEGPVEGLDARDRANAAAKVERYANRATDDLRAALVEGAQARGGTR